MILIQNEYLEQVNISLQVIFGGGRKNFIPNTETDASGARGLRTDGKNLIQEWKESKTGNAVYITTNVSSLIIYDSPCQLTSECCSYLNVAVLIAFLSRTGNNKAPHTAATKSMQLFSWHFKAAHNGYQLNWGCIETEQTFSVRQEKNNRSELSPVCGSTGYA